MKIFSHNFFNFVTSIFFHARMCLSFVRMLFNKIFIKVNMWSNDWLKFDLTSQCINLFFKCFNIKTKSMIKNLFFICHVNIFCDRVKFNFAFLTNFINCVAETCFVNRAGPHHMKWCRLKFFKNMCSTFVFNCFLINDSVNGLFIDTYN